jgi:hypothetical protein
MTSSTEKQTRNSAGKTSLIEIIHFLLGADCDKDSLFRTPALLLHRFEGTFDLPEGTFVVERGERNHREFSLYSGRIRPKSNSRKTRQRAGRMSPIAPGRHISVTSNLRCRLIGLEHPLILQDLRATDRYSPILQGDGTPAAANIRKGSLRSSNVPIGR